MGPVRMQRREDLWDLLVATPGGVTVEDMMGVYGWTHGQANEAVHDLRDWLGEFDITLPCDPQGQRERWLYRLVEDLDGVRQWAGNRVQDTDTRLRTMHAMLTSIVSATDGRTVEGRTARIMERALRRLVEDLDDLRHNGVSP
jgi:hypothetical protein